MLLPIPKHHQYCFQSHSIINAATNPNTSTMLLPIPMHHQCCYPSQGITNAATLPKASAMLLPLIPMHQQCRSCTSQYINNAAARPKVSAMLATHLNPSTMLLTHPMHQQYCYPPQGINNVTAHPNVLAVLLPISMCQQCCCYQS